MNLDAPELLLILAIVALIFGADRLPKLARSLGQAQREFRRGTEEVTAPDRTAAPSELDR